MNDPGVYNTRPRPRMLIRGFENDPELVARVRSLVPTSLQISDLDEINQREWDLVVTDGYYGAFMDHLYVVYRAPGANVSATLDSAQRWRNDIDHRGGVVENQLRRVPELPDRVRPLVELLEPVLKQRRTHEVFYHGMSSSWTVATGQAPQLVPFATTDTGHTLVASYTRPGPGAQVWLLPSDVPDLVPWVRAALAEWSGLEPARFPGIPDWSEQPEWATPQERSVLERTEELRRQAEEYVAAYTREKRELDAELIAARQAADQYERGLLTLSEHELVPVVQRALEELGFRVTDYDAVLRAEQGDRFTALEDLHVEDPEVEDWIALAEVKGYKKGAQTSALGQLDRFQRLHVERTARWASRLWYIANQFKDRDPSTRQTILQSNDADVRGFGERDGLVIDTQDLFKLLMAVRQGELTKEQARESLRSQTGRYEVPHAEHHTEKSVSPAVDSG